MKELEFPNIPVFENDTVEKCRQTKDYKPIFFELYKHVGIICYLFSCIVPDTNAVRNIHKQHFETLIGLLNRCSRLMLANTVLSHDGKFGETTAIIDRCIVESAINVIWLCKKNDNESFERYLADGLKSDLELESKVLENINARDGKVLVIEERMLNSIDRCVNLSGLQKDKIHQIRKFPNMVTRLDDIGFGSLAYTSIQRMGSHHVHGTWSSLLFHYLKEENGKLLPQDHPISTDVIQFINIPLVILDALKNFIDFIIIDKEVGNPYVSELYKIREILDEYRIEEAGNDFETK